MKTAWTRALVLLFGSLAAVAAAAWMIRTVRAQAGAPQRLESARQAFQAGGGEQGIADRQRILTEMHARLERERAAMSSDAGLFSRRVGEVFEELGLVVTTSSSWRAVTGFEEGQAAAFERTFAGSGAFEALLDALGTIESWPDRARVRSLLVAPEGPGSVSFNVEIAALRLRRPAKDDS